MVCLIKAQRRHHENMDKLLYEYNAQFFFKEKFKMKKCTVFVIFQYIEKKWNIL